ncbi:MAG: 2-C-methyl-D-erythritol 4-phosphate cytidylyltransferase, partial [Acidimicrobiia bacterium]|nr:2-C-methyl-D-erythritol 4-phosphate cytidylyltransferase [Acidimicrobiia bacterium]
VVPIVPVRDALKHVAGDMIAASVDRSNMAAVQTPQGFMTRSLLLAHEHSSEDAADDAELIERWGGTVATVQGDATNVKITYPEDLLLVRALWSARS